jgi:ferrous-iron efflux pump FieF
MFQVVLISISALGLAWRAVGQFLGGERVAEAESGVIVSVVAMVATVALLAYQRHVIRQTGSLAISTDNVHYKSDLFSTSR